MDDPTVLTSRLSQRGLDLTYRSLTWSSGLYQARLGASRRTHRSNLFPFVKPR